MIKKVDHRQVHIAEELLSIQLPAYRVEAELIGCHDIPALKQTARTIQQSEDTYTAFFQEDKMAGFISYGQEDRKLRICSLVVHPDYFRKGIGQKILCFFLENLAGEQCIIVSTGSRNIPALALYKKHGFKEVNQHPIGNGVYLTELELELKS
ncbi:GNAT family N-acetyltransferase [Bacillus sp. 1P06AnD]|uniref:GNAT family N-acetyltransferase n=1 Tax=Bacillus sp. 1P06AnD TaxID=3132208 RepID=UPI0039A2BAF2